MTNPGADNQVALLEAFKQHLLAEDTSQNTVNAYVSDLSQFMNWYIPRADPASGSRNH